MSSKIASFLSVVLSVPTIFAEYLHILTERKQLMSSLFIYQRSLWGIWLVLISFRVLTVLIFSQIGLFVKMRKSVQWCHVCWHINFFIETVWQVLVLFGVVKCPNSYTNFWLRTGVVFLKVSILYRIVVLLRISSSPLCLKVYRLPGKARNRKSSFLEILEFVKGRITKNLHTSVS